MADKGRPLTTEEVLEILANPVYAGCGPFPAIIDDATWIAAASQVVSEIGLDAFLRALLQALRKTFDGAILP
jgi:hypothetical protein